VVCINALPARKDGVKGVIEVYVEVRAVGQLDPLAEGIVPERYVQVEYQGAVREVVCNIDVAGRPPY